MSASQWHEKLWGDSFKWTYILADISKCILSNDVVMHHGPAVNLAGWHLVHRLQDYKFQGYAYCKSRVVLLLRGCSFKRRSPPLVPIQSTLAKQKRPGQICSYS